MLLPAIRPLVLREPGQDSFLLIRRLNRLLGHNVFFDNLGWYQPLYESGQRPVNDFQGEP